MSGTAVTAARTVAVVVPTVFVAVFYAYPVASVVAEGLLGDGAAALSALSESARFRDIVWFTIWQAAASTALALIVGLPAAAMVARLGRRWQQIVRALVIIPFVLPTVVVAAAFEGVFSRTGMADGSIRLHHTVWAILLAHVFFNYAVVVRTVGAYWEGLDGRLEDQARVLGAGRARTFLEITLPRLRPAVAAAASIVFLFSFTSFGIILILGGPRRATIETEIYRQAVTRTDLATASAVALVQLLCVLALVVVTTRLERRRGSLRSRPRPQSGRPGSLLVAANVVVMVGLLGLPILVLVEQSLASGSGYSLRHYGALFQRVPQLPTTAAAAIGNSLVFATVATALAAVIGTLGALVAVHGRGSLRRVFDLGLTLPLGTSAVTLGFGILLALDEPPLAFRTSRWIIPVAHALVAIPFVVRTMVPVLRSIDYRLRDAATVLGASPVRARREIDVPLGSRALMVAAAFAFAISLGEFGATSFMPRRIETLTAPVALFRLLSTPGDLLRGQAMALAVVLMMLTAAAALIIESRRGARGGAF